MKRILILPLLLGAVLQASAQRQMEQLDRGLIVMPKEAGRFVSWRMLGTDNTNIGFNVYRAEGNKFTKLNASPVTNVTSFVDNTAKAGMAYKYQVRPVVNGKEGAVEGAFTSGANAQPYLSVPLQTPPGYTPNDASVGDLTEMAGMRSCCTRREERKIIRRPALPTHQFFRHIRWKVNCYGPSTWEKISGKVRTIRNLWYTTWMATAVRKLP
nr:hypothetical protein [Chitinophaga sedimenti]